MHFREREQGIKKVYFLEGECWRMFNVDMKRLYKSDFRLVSFTIAIPVIIIYIVTIQTSWAAIIDSSDALECNGTSADDVIIATTPNAIIHGLKSNDFIYAGRGSDTINGGPGDDLIHPNPPYRDFSYDSVDCGSGERCRW
jgi:hypothetical protein